MFPPLILEFVPSQQSNQSDPFKTVTDYATQNPPMATQGKNQNHPQGLWAPNYLIPASNCFNFISCSSPATQPSLLLVPGT